MFGENIIYMRTDTTARNGIGDAVVSSTYRKVYAKKKSVRSSEFYQAQATDLRPEIVFDIWLKDYQNEQNIKYNDEQYNIIRTYEKGDRIELVVQREN